MKLVTHNDVDGLISAVLAAKATGVDKVVFTYPDESKRHVQEGDIVTDLPFSINAGTWIDHHISQKPLVEGRKIRGLFDPSARCAAELVAKHFKLEDSNSKKLVDLAIKADTFDLNDTVTKMFESIIEYQRNQETLEHLFSLFLYTDFDDVVSAPEVLELYEKFVEFMEVPTLHELNNISREIIKKKVILLDAFSSPAFSPKVAERYLYKRDYDVIAVIKKVSPEKGKISINCNPIKHVSFNCARIAEHFGGGGHSFAAGASFLAIKKEETVAELINLSRNEYEHSFSIRPMLSSDIDIVSNLHNIAGFNFNTEGSIKKFYDETFDPESVIVYEENGEVLGCMEMSRGENSEFGSFYIIGRLVVHPEYRNRGIGTNLLQFVIDRGRREGISSVDLFVSSKNEDAKKLYESLGFSIVETDLHMKMKLSD